MQNIIGFILGLGAAVLGFAGMVYYILFIVWLIA
jgi:hypothetical protein